MKKKSTNNIKRKYYGLLRYSYTDKNKGDVFSLLETQGDCCCFEEGVKLFDNKKEALGERRDNELPDRLVEFTVKLIK